MDSSLSEVQPCTKTIFVWTLLSKLDVSWQIWHNMAPWLLPVVCDAEAPVCIYFSHGLLVCHNVRKECFLPSFSYLACCSNVFVFRLFLFNWQWNAFEKSPHVFPRFLHFLQYGSWQHENCTFDYHMWETPHHPIWRLKELPELKCCYVFRKLDGWSKNKGHRNVTLNSSKGQVF